MARPEEPRAKLGWLFDGEFRFDPAGGPCRVAADRLVVAVRELGRIEAIDEALCAVVVALGESVDGDPTNASLWGQFRAALAELRGVGVNDGDDGIDTFLASLSGGPDLRDAS